MTKTTPNYLRIHRGANRSKTTQPTNATDTVKQFWNAYSHATGWRIDQRSSRRAAKLDLLPAVTDETIEKSQEELPAVSKLTAIRLAQSAAQLADELRRSQETIRGQGAELACHAALIGVDLDRKAIADQIEQTLADVVAACRCDAAALYMLDDDTQYLKTRAIYGLPAERLETAPRELRGSRGDLEAMVQGVVTIDDFDAGSIDTWNCPESFQAGICVAIKTDDVPIGTLWLFREQAADFGTAESAAARLAAAHLSLQLAQLSKARSAESVAIETSIQGIAQWQYESLPIGSTLADGWRVDGMIDSSNHWATGWHNWDVLPDGSLMLAMVEAIDASSRGAMHAATARSALVAHTGYRHTPSQVLQRVSDTLWHTSTGEQLVSLLYACIDPETGEGEVASAGSINAMIANRHGYRPLVNGNSEPLNTHIDARCVVESFRLLQGETLLAFSRGFLVDGASQRVLGDHLRSAMKADDKNPLALIRRKLASLPLTQERGALTLLRH